MILDIIGAPYEGKTLYMTNLCMEAKIKNMECWTTYYTKYSHTLDTLSQLEDLEYKGDSQIFVGLDDFVSWLDCRNANRNTASTWMFNKYRKLGLCIVYDEQIKGAIDFRLGDITNIFFYTRQIKFPRFEIIPKLPDGTLANEPFEIVYGNDVSQSYNTLEQVEKRIRHSELIKMYDSIKDVDSGAKKLFALRLKSKFGISKDNGELILSLVEAKKEEILEEMFKDLGFKFIGDS